MHAAGRYTIFLLLFVVLFLSVVTMLTDGNITGAITAASENRETYQSMKELVLYGIGIAVVVLLLLYILLFHKRV